MAVTQISRIQHRRGLEQDLPSLSSAELGWSLDTRQLYIGNGTIEEGAPIVGVTRILTEHDITNITSNTNFTSYTFVGNAAGYNAQTGASSLSPVVRNYQQKFDDIVNIRDFGAVGDGTTDDTDSINRAIQQIYKSTVSPTEARARRTIYFPGGSYLTSNPILIPPYAKLIGDGINSAIIIQSKGNRTVANVCDSLFQTGSSLGSGSAILPQDVEINGIQFHNSNASVVSPLFVLDSASNVRVQMCKFRSNSGAGFYPNLVSIETSVATTQKITFEGCQFVSGGNGISVLGSAVKSIRVLNSEFNNLSNIAFNTNSSINCTSIGNYYGTVGGYIVHSDTSGFVSLGDYYETFYGLNTGLHLGNLQLTTTQEYTLTTTSLALFPTSNAASSLNYQIKNSNSIRFGQINFTATNTQIVFDDSYVETTSGVSANISANSNAILISVNSGTATFKYNSLKFN